MKVAMLGVNPKSKGGIASVICNFQEHFDDSKIEMLHYSTWEEGSFLKQLWRSFFQLVGFPYFIRKNKITIVHLHVAQDGSFYRKSLFLLIAQKLNRKVIVHLHASQFERFYKQQKGKGKRYIQKILSKADCVVVLSEEWKTFYQSIVNRDYIIIENAVVSPDENNYHTNRKNIASFGRLGSRKGSYDILEMAKSLKKSHPEILITLYGDGSVNEIQRLIDSHSLTNVRLGGWIDSAEKKQVMNNLKLHILPSYQEGMPMSILETLGYGIPNIASNVGGIPQIIESGWNGQLIRPGDVKALTEAVQNILDDDALAIKYSLNGYQTVKEKFSLKAYHEKWRELYDQLGN